MFTPFGNQLEDFSDDILLLGLITHKVIEVYQARLAVIIDNKDGLYHCVHA
jgi:hypothetical protein